MENNQNNSDIKSNFEAQRKEYENLCKAALRADVDKVKKVVSLLVYNGIKLDYKILYDGIDELKMICGKNRSDAACKDKEERYEKIQNIILQNLQKYCVGIELNENNIVFQPLRKKCKVILDYCKKDCIQLVSNSNSVSETFWQNNNINTNISSKAPYANSPHNSSKKYNNLSSANKSRNNGNYKNKYNYSKSNANATQNNARNINKNSGASSSSNYSNYNNNYRNNFPNTNNNSTFHPYQPYANQSRNNSNKYNSHSVANSYSNYGNYNNNYRNDFPNTNNNSTFHPYANQSGNNSNEYNSHSVASSSSNYGNYGNYHNNYGSTFTNNNSYSTYHPTQPYANQSGNNSIGYNTSYPPLTIASQPTDNSTTNNNHSGATSSNNNIINENRNENGNNSAKGKNQKLSKKAPEFTPSNKK